MIRIYDTKMHKKVDLVTLEHGKVKMYVCGPTVYNYIHIGNARTFISFDVIRRYLEWRGYEVVFVQNVTDVDDKIIGKANDEGRTADFQDHYYPSEMSVDAQIQTFLIDGDVDKFLAKFDSDWTRYNRDIIQKVQDYYATQG